MPVATATTLSLTSDQVLARDAGVSFFEETKKMLLTLAGFAGTGKTTVIAEIVKIFNGKKKRPSFAFCAFTGRAAHVLRGKLERAGALQLEDYCGTIHGLIYVPVVKKGHVRRWRRVDKIEQDFIIVDEASMVNEKILKDLQRYGKPILAVGDHGQLPPVTGNFNLMENPEIRLETIHRQAAGNPIIQMSLRVRNGEEIPAGTYGEGVIKVGPQLDIERFLNRVSDIENVLLLCGMNEARVRLNGYMRRRIFAATPPAPAVPIIGDKLICLKNNHEKKIFNGMTGRLQEIGEGGAHWWKVKIAMDDGVEGEVLEDLVLKEQFNSPRTLKEVDDLEPKDLGEQFDFGYAMTVHKAQGSEARRVVLIEQRMSSMDDEQWRRWLYTGITRSSERLLIVGRS